MKIRNTKKSFSLIFRPGSTDMHQARICLSLIHLLFAIYCLHSSTGTHLNCGHSSLGFAMEIKLVRTKASRKCSILEEYVKFHGCSKAGKSVSTRVAVK